MATQFRKNNRGLWVVMGTTSEVRIGRVLVQKADGTKTSVEVASVGVPFFVKGSKMVYGYIADKVVKPVQTSPAPVSQEYDETEMEVLNEKKADRMAMSDENLSGDCDVF